MQGTHTQSRLASGGVGAWRARRPRALLAGRRVVGAGDASGREEDLGGLVLWAEAPVAQMLPDTGPLSSASTAWQGVERDLRSQLSGGERGLVEEYVEKVPNPGLKSEWVRGAGRAPASCTLS